MEVHVCALQIDWSNIFRLHPSRAGQSDSRAPRSCADRASIVTHAVLTYRIFSQIFVLREAFSGSAPLASAACPYARSAQSSLQCTTSGCSPPTAPSACSPAPIEWHLARSSFHEFEASPVKIRVHIVNAQNQRVLGYHRAHRCTQRVVLNLVHCTLC